MPTEAQMRHGAIPLHPIHRRFRKMMRKKIVRGMGVDWTKPFSTFRFPIKNQSTNDSCSGQASSMALQIERKSRGIIEGEISAKSFYAPIAYSGGGTTVVALERQFKLSGANLEASVPSYDAQGNPLPEYLVADKSWMTPALTADAVTRAGYTLYDCGVDIENVAQAIEDYGFVIFEVQGQDNGSWTSAFPTPPSKTNPNQIWSHFMVFFDFCTINGVKYLAAYQSMGIGWGQGGIQFFGKNYFDSGYIIDCFTFQFDGKIQVPVMPPRSLWSSLADWFSGWFALDKFLGSTKGVSL